MDKIIVVFLQLEYQIMLKEHIKSLIKFKLKINLKKLILSLNFN